MGTTPEAATEGPRRLEDCPEYVEKVRHLGSLKDLVRQREVELQEAVDALNRLPNKAERVDGEVASLLSTGDKLVEDSRQREGLLAEIEKRQHELDIAVEAVKQQHRIVAHAKEAAAEQCRTTLLPEHKRLVGEVVKQAAALRMAYHRERRFLRDLRQAGLVEESLVGAYAERGPGKPMIGAKVGFIGSGRGATSKIDAWIKRKQDYVADLVEEAQPCQ